MKLYTKSVYRVLLFNSLSVSRDRFEFRLGFWKMSESFAYEREG